MKIKGTESLARVSTAICPRPIRCPVMRRLVFVLAIMLLGAATAEAQTYYVREGAGGTGSNWTNAYSSLPPTLVRGAIYYVAAGRYDGYTFDDAVAGSTPITIKKATVADHGTESGWQPAFANPAVFRGTLHFRTNHFVIDGQTRHADWRSGYGFTIDVSQAGGSYGVVIGIPFELAVSHITMRYVEIAGTGDRTDRYNDRGFITALGSSDITIAFSYIHDQGESNLHLFRTNNVLIEYTWIARNHSSPAQHAEGIAAPEGTSGFILRYSVMEDIEGTAYIGTPTGGHPGCAGTVQRDWYFYGNVFFRRAGSTSGTGGGIVYVFDHRHAGDFHFYNNSIVNVGSGFVGFDGACGDSMRVQNNLWYGIENTMYRTANVANLTWSHNAYFNTATGDTDPDRQVSATNPFVNWIGDDFRLAAATRPGVFLGAPYLVDVAGMVRGSDGVWDRGAFEFGGTVQPLAPLSVTLNQSTFRPSDTLVATIRASGGVVQTPVDVYVVVQAGGTFLSLQLDGRLVPGLVPIARQIVLPSAVVSFSFPLATAPVGNYAWLAGLTLPGTLTLVTPVQTTPFSIVP
jgi:hypothetical protein